MIEAPPLTPATRERAYVVQQTARTPLGPAFLEILKRFICEADQPSAVLGAADETYHREGRRFVWLEIERLLETDLSAEDIATHSPEEPTE